MTKKEQEEKIHSKNLHKLLSILHGIPMMMWSRYDVVLTNMCD
jgi:hypothetical protein